MRITLAVLLIATVLSFSAQSQNRSLSTARFDDVTESAGVARTNISYSTAWADYDNDSDPDLLVTYLDHHDILYRNLGNGTFDDATTISGLIDVEDSGAEGAVWADYDNDGDVDLFVANGCEPQPNDPSVLYRNNGDGTLTVVTAAAGLHYVGSTESVAWADYDRDGLADLYVGHLRADPNPGNFLYRNLGNGRFANVAAAAGVADSRDSNGGVAWGDYDNDGDPDLYVGNRREPNAFYRNDGNGTFVDIAVAAGVADANNSEGVAWADYDNDGWLDLYVANLDAPNRLYHNERDNTFRDVSSASGTNLPGQSVGANWADYDNDGWIDLYVVLINGANRLYRNQGNGTFVDVAATEGVAFHTNGRVGAWADFNRDGFQDLFVANFGPNKLFRNTGNSNRWISVRALGVVSNRSAIGTRVEARALINGAVRTQIREVSAGGSRHSQDSIEVEFGLGHATTVDLTLTFPSGAVRNLSNVQTNQFIDVIETSYAVTPTTTVLRPDAIERTFQLTTNTPAAPWTSSTNAPWITVSPASGIGSAVLSYHAERNPAQTSRTATITVGATTLSVTQLPNGIPGPPASMGATANEFRTRLMWSPPATAGSPTSYTLSAGTSPDATNLGSVQLSGQTLTYTVDGIPPGRYFVRTRGQNEFGIGPPSEELELVIGSSGSSIPGAPGSLRFSRDASSSITFTWSPSFTGGAQAGYVIEAGDGPAQANLAIISIAPTTPRATFANVPRGLYYVRVRATNSDGVGPPSNEVLVNVGALPAPPGAPTGLQAGLSGRTVTLSWMPAVDDGGAPTRYLIEIGSASGLANYGSVFTSDATSSFAFANAPLGSYFVRVKAANALGISGASNEVRVVVQ